ncbi:MAG: WIAG-tail domain, partial [Planifilum fulgidum]
QVGTGEALKDQSVTGEKIADGSIGPEKLSFPIFSQPVVQCGTATFSIAEYERETEVEVPLNFPFAHEGYVVVAMTDRSGCWSLLRERKEDSFTLVVQHDGTAGSQVEGTVFWIGMGHHRPVVEELQPLETEPVSSTEEEREQDVLPFNTGVPTETSEDIPTEDAVSTIQSIDPAGDAEEEED